LFDYIEAEANVEGEARLEVRVEFEIFIFLSKRNIISFGYKDFEYIL